jgi:hypothetical protein
MIWDLVGSQTPNTACDDLAVADVGFLGIGHDPDRAFRDARARADAV